MHIEPITVAGTAFDTIAAGILAIELAEIAKEERRTAEYWRLVLDCGHDANALLDAPYNGPHTMRPGFALPGHLARGN